LWALWRSAGWSGAATAGRPRHKEGCRHCPSPGGRRTHPPGITRA